MFAFPRGAGLARSRDSSGATGEANGEERQVGGSNHYGTLLGSSARCGGSGEHVASWVGMGPEGVRDMSQTESPALNLGGQYPSFLEGRVRGVQITQQMGGSCEPDLESEPTDPQQQDSLTPSATHMPPSITLLWLALWTVAPVARFQHLPVITFQGLLRSLHPADVRPVRFSLEQKWSPQGTRVLPGAGNSGTSMGETILPTTRSPTHESLSHS